MHVHKKGNSCVLFPLHFKFANLFICILKRTPISFIKNNLGVTSWFLMNYPFWMSLGKHTTVTFVMDYTGDFTKDEGLLSGSTVYVLKAKELKYTVRISDKGKDDYKQAVIDCCTDYCDYFY